MGGDKISEITICKIKAKHLKGIKLSSDIGMDEIVKIVSKMNNIPEKIVEDLDIEDFPEISAAIASFLSFGQEIGKTP